MKIRLNGKLQDTQAQNVAVLIRQLDLPAQSVVVEHNGRIVRQEGWPEAMLQDNDTIEVLNFVGGG